MKTVKVTVQRVAEAGAAADKYRFTKLNGAAEVGLFADNGVKHKIFTVGDQLAHDELKRLCEVEQYDVTILAPEK